MSKPKIMIVEDEAAIAADLRKEAERLGYEVSAVLNNGENALESAVKQHPDLALIDLALNGDINGIKTAEAFRSSLNIPVVIIAAPGEETLLKTSAPTLSAGYVMKPIRPDELNAAINAALKGAATSGWIGSEPGNCEQQLKLVEEIGSIGHWVYKVDTKETFWSDELYRLFDRNPLMGPPAIEEEKNCYSPEEMEKLLSHRRKAMETGERSKCDVEVKLPNGKSIFLEWAVLPLKNENGRVVELFGVVQDITRWKRMERELRMSQARLNKAQRIAHIGSYDQNLVVDELLWSDEQFRLWGYEPGEVVPSFDLVLGRIHPNDRETLLKTNQEAFEGSGFHDVEYRIIRQDGAVRFMRSIGEIERDGDGRPIWRQGVLQDITDRKLAEEAWRESEEKFRLLFEHSLEAILLTSPDSRIISANPEACRMLGYSRNELAGLSSETVMDQADPRYSFALEERTLTGSFRGELILKKKNGERIPVDISIITYKDRYNQKMACTIIRDLTEKKRSREEMEKLDTYLRQVQKMEALGTLAGGIAHDFNNTLGIIVANSEFALADLGDDDLIRPNLELIYKAASRARDLARQILTFSRRSRTEFNPMRVTIILREVLKFLRASLPSTVEIRQKLTAKADVIMADPSQIHQVVMNLCANAAHAMQEKGGVLEVKLEEVSLDSPLKAHCRDVGPGDFINLTVRDNGPGMDKTVLGRIFDPFFTTKKSGEGTGMGLSVVHGIVLNHQGGIVVDSGPGRGTTFNVYFPRINIEPAREEKTLYSLPKGVERILYIDDDPDMVQSTTFILERLGYTVTAFTNSKEALRTFHARSAQFDLIITDQTMPHMTGIDLVKEIKHIRPDIPIIICTGFSEAVTPERIKATGIQEMLQKPVTSRDWATTIRRLLDGEA